MALLLLEFCVIIFGLLVPLWVEMLALTLLLTAAEAAAVFDCSFF